MARRGHDEPTILLALLVFNKEEGIPPLSESEVAGIARSAIRYGAVPVKADAFRATDIWNAERLVAIHGDDIRYCPALGQWFAWDGVVWCAAEAPATLERLAKETVNGLWQHVLKFSDGAPKGEKSPQDTYVGHIIASSRAPRLRDMVTVARSEGAIAAKPADFDADRFVLNCPNGMLDLQTGALRPHDRSDLVTMTTGVEYEPDAKSPVWDAFLDRVMDHDQEMIAFLQRAAGYALTGSVKAECFFVLYGSGANGKSKFIGAIEHALGGYARSFPIEMLLRKKYDAIECELAELRGIRFAPTMEHENADRQLDEGKVKKLTGGDMQHARKLYGNPFTFEPHFKIFVGTNQKPTIRATDEAMWRRVRLIPFDVTIPEAERDGDLPDKLKAEAAGILAWAVRGCRAWLAGGLKEPAKVLAATQDYREEEDDVGAFIEACCAVSKSSMVAKAKLYEAYESFSDEPMSQKAFTQRLREKKFEEGRAHVGRKKVRTWEGLTLFEEAAAEAA
jgi:putative DNA primase/helicase